MASSLKESIMEDEYMCNLDKLMVLLTGYHVYQIDIDKLNDTMVKLYEQTERIIKLDKEIGLNLLKDIKNGEEAVAMNNIKTVVDFLTDCKEANNKEDGDNELSIDNIEIKDEDIKDKDGTVDTLNLLDETKADQWYSQKTRQLAESGKTEEEISEENNSDSLIINYEKDKEEIDELVNKKQDFWKLFKERYGEDSIYSKAILGDDELIQFDLQTLIKEIEEEEKEEIGRAAGDSNTANNMAPII